ncbi:MAG: DinB family protein [Synechococcaceae cyanobacterium]|nr:DinB family protein [Synechococcaceae cyanobacterium]
MHAEIEAVRDRLGRQTEDITTLVRGLDDDTFSRRPAEGRWAVAEHLAHLCKTIPPYSQARREAVGRARERGWAHGKGPFRGTWLGEKFKGMLEPPPKRRVKTFGAMTPPPPEKLDRDETLARFRACQEELTGVLASGDGLDLGRARVRSPFAPFLPFLRFAVIQSGVHMAAHTDRHLWLMREALEQMGVVDPSAPDLDEEPGSPGASPA